MLSRVANEKERQFIERRLGLPIHRFSDFSSFMETGNKRVWATYRACKIISAVVVSAGVKVIKKGSEDSDQVEIPEGPDTVRLSSGGFLSQPNPYDSWEELMQMVVFHLELVGNAYLLKDEMDALGRPTAIYPLLPQYVKLVPSKNEKVSRYIYAVNGTEVQFEANEIIHIKETNPADLHMGMGSIEPSQTIYSQYINKAALEERFVENGAHLSGILTREDEGANEIDEERWDQLKKKFNLEYSGKRNTGKVMFLNGKWAFHKLGLSMTEMQSLEREKWTVEQIFLNHGVPLSVAGLQVNNYATARQDEINFRKFKAVPLLDLIIGKLNADGFIQAVDPDHVLVYELSGLIDVEQVVKEYGPLLKMGALTRNELRTLCGLGVINDPLLDEFTVEGNVIPLSLIGTGDPSPAVDPK